MFQKFNVDTLPSNFIKYILSEVNVPVIQFTSNVEYVTPGATYIHNNYIVKIKTREDENGVVDFGPYLVSSLTTSDFIMYEPYVFGKEYVGLTTRYKSNTNSYDSNTHYYLGLYLRLLKGFYKVDLMPFYNCFTNQYSTDVAYDLSCYSEKDSSSFYVGRFVAKYCSTFPENSRILSVPIRFGESYTIAVECPTRVEMVPCFVDDNGLIQQQTELLHKCISWRFNKDSSEVKNYVKSVTRFSEPEIFHSPVIPYELEDTSSGELISTYTLHAYEKYLRLLIKLPEDCDSSIVVLRGVYKNIKPYADKVINTSQEDVINASKIEKTTKSFYTDFSMYLNDNLYTNLSLLRMNDRNTYAFSNRLVEYLCNNVITSNEKLRNNIKLIEESVYDSSVIPTGIWSDEMRVVTFNNVNQFINQYSRSNIMDMNGFIDKDTESIITGDLYKKWSLKQ